jgi:ArsR family transcriptional regulator
MEKTLDCCGGVSQWLLPNVFKALSDPTRVAILASLAEKNREQTVSEVSECCPIDLSVVSRHLKLLRDAGILEAEKRGKEVFYRVKVDEFVSLLRNLADALETCCPGGVCATTGDTDE